MNPTLIQRHLTRIETLTESNYSTWKMKLQIVLGSLDYDFVLTESKLIIDPTTTDAQKKQQLRYSSTNGLRPTR